MGLWNWLIDQLSTPQSDQPDGESPGRPVTTSRNDKPVAVLDSADNVRPPDEAGTVEAWWQPEGDAQLVEPVELERPPLTTEARALENLLVSYFDGHDLNMPPLLDKAERVLRLLRKRECNLAAVAREVGDDQILSAAVLRLANSPLYRGLNKITAIQPAVTRLGTKALHTLMVHESVRAVTMHDKNDSPRLAQLLWLRSMANAYVMRELSAFTGIDGEDAHLIGLLHDIGNVLVLRISCSTRWLGTTSIDVNTFEYLCAECHQEFGELIAEAWCLPPTIKSLIGNHHTTPQPDDALRVERLQLQLANMICSLLGYMPYAPYDLLNSRPAQELGLTERPDFVPFLSHLPTKMEDSIETF